MRQFAGGPQHTAGPELEKAGSFPWPHILSTTELLHEGPVCLPGSGSQLMKHVVRAAAFGVGRDSSEGQVGD